MSTKAPFTQGCNPVPPLSNQKIDQDAQWLPNPRNLLFLCNCCSTTPVRSLNHQNCYSGTRSRAKGAEWKQNHCHGGSKVTVVAEWRHSGHHSDRSIDATGRLKEAQWWYKGGRSIAQIHTQCIQHYAFFTERPMADPSAPILRSRRCLCLPLASFERPVSDQPPRRPLCDCFEHAENFTGTMSSMARSPWCLQLRIGRFCGFTREAQVSQLLCKGGYDVLMTTGVAYGIAL